MLNFLQFLEEREGVVRRWTYQIAAGAAITIAAMYTSGTAGLKLSLIWVGCLVGGAGILEGLLALARSIHPLEVVFAASKLQLTQQQLSLPRLIEEADRVDILSGTLASFTSREAILKSLSQKARAQDDDKIRVLMLHPEGVGLEQLVRSRRSRGMNSTVDKLRAEVRKSMDRLVQFLGADVASDVIRLYKVPRTISVYRFDDKYLTTCYTFGRGGSSPAFYLRSSSRSAEFCGGLDRGIRELWKSESTVPLRSPSPAE